MGGLMKNVLQLSRMEEGRRRKSYCGGQYNDKIHRKHYESVRSVLELACGLIEG